VQQATQLSLELTEGSAAAAAAGSGALGGAKDDGDWPRLPGSWLFSAGTAFLAAAELHVIRRMAA